MGAIRCLGEARGHTPTPIDFCFGCTHGRATRRPTDAPETMVLPSEVKRPQVTGPSWPVNTCTQSPVAASHIQTVQSLEPAISTLPGWVGRLCVGVGVGGGAGVSRPEPVRARKSAGTPRTLAVPVEPLHVLGPLQRADQRPRLGVPDHELPAVRALCGLWFVCLHNIQGEPAVNASMRNSHTQVSVWNAPWRPWSHRS